jgi:serine phosphatase RsbU (regulator of sigma subunit)
MTERVAVRFESYVERAQLWVEVHVYPTLDGISMLVSDITERKAADEREAENRRLDEALATIENSVTTTLDSGEILRRLVQLSAEAVGAETAGLTLSDHGAWLVRETMGVPRESLRSVLTDPRLEAALLSTAASEPVVINDVRDDPRVDRQIMEGLGVQSLMAVPLTVKNNLLGALVFHHRSEATAFTSGQIDFAANLASLASLALENARLFERERRIADTLQQALLSDPEEAEGFESAVVYRPASDSANVGGDFYDVFVLDDGSVCFTIGDVSGKGLGAARLTSVLHDGIRAFAYEDSDPSTILRHVNALVHRMSRVEQFSTMVLGVLNPATGRLRYCVAGHPHPVIVSADGVRMLDGGHSPIVGGFREVAFATEETILNLGEMLVLYTDGLTEARAQRDMFGEQRLVSALTTLKHTSTRRMPERLLSAVLKFAGGTLHDDTVILCLKRTGTSDLE